MKNHLKIGIIGVGAIGSIIGKRLISNGYKVLGSRRSSFKFKGMETTTKNSVLVERSDVIILATKQKDLKGLSHEISDKIGSKLVISLIAGVRISQIERMFRAKKVARAMTNIAFSDGNAISAFCCNKAVSKSEKKITKSIFDAGGKVIRLDENLMDSFTVLDSCAIAFYATLLNSVNISAAKTLGFEPKFAKWIIISTMEATLGKASSTQTFDDLIRQVSTKGGMTDAGLKAFKKGDLYGLVDKAYRAALKRSLALKAMAEQA